MNYGGYDAIRSNIPLLVRATVRSPSLTRDGDCTVTEGRPQAMVRSAAFPIGMGVRAEKTPHASLVIGKNVLYVVGAETYGLSFRHGIKCEVC